MTINSAPADSSRAAVPAASDVSRSAAPRRSPWLLAAFLLAGAAQLITISALLSADPIAANWSSLLLAIAPALLAAAAAFAPAPVGRLAAVAGVAVLIAGIAGQASQTGVDWVFIFFFPALVLLAVGGAKLWREQP
jgi:hypothetical protein